MEISQYHVKLYISSNIPYYKFYNNRLLYYTIGMKSSVRRQTSNKSRRKNNKTRNKQHSNKHRQRYSSKKKQQKTATKKINRRKKTIRKNRAIQQGFGLYERSTSSGSATERLTLPPRRQSVYNAQGNQYIVFSDVEGGNIFHGINKEIMQKLGLVYPHDSKRLIELNSGVGLVFLGDAQDNGEYSIRWMMSLLKLKEEHPDKVILIAGNRDSNKVRWADEAHMSVIVDGHVSIGHEALDRDTVGHETTNHDTVGHETLDRGTEGHATTRHETIGQQHKSLQNLLVKECKTQFQMPVPDRSVYRVHQSHISLVHLEWLRVNLSNLLLHPRLVPGGQCHWYPLPQYIADSASLLDGVVCFLIVRVSFILLL